MNLVGKIFVVLIFVMSLVFMAFSIATYATHRNWRDEVLGNQAKNKVGLKEELQKAENRYKEVEAARLRLETELANVNSSKAAGRGRVWSRNATTRPGESPRLNTEVNRLNKDVADAVNTMGLTQDTLKKLREQMAVTAGAARHGPPGA